jgi:hypothetical protein
VIANRDVDVVSLHKPKIKQIFTEAIIVVMVVVVVVVVLLLVVVVVVVVIMIITKLDILQPNSVLSHSQ